MALMIPEICNARCNSSVTKGERKIFDLLKLNLNDDYTIYFDININGRYPDFVIVGRDIGVIVLEIKDYKISTISQLPGGYGNLKIRVDEIDTNGNMCKVEKNMNPYEQARTYLNTIKNNLAFGFNFNFNSIVIFPFLKEKDLEDKFDGYHRCLPKDKTIYKEDLDCIENGTINLEELIKSKCKYLGYILNDANIEQINSYIYPLSKPNMKRLEENINREIEEKLKEFKSGKYILQGVSGSGKTIYLTTLAKLRLKLIEQHGFSEKVLITAFNNTLISFFKEYFKDYEHIDVRTKYQLTNQKHKEKYGLILIDEGQDFSLDDLKYIISNYSNSKGNEYFMIAMDGAQNIYDEKNFIISELGENIKIEKLNQNYRNNKSIFEFSNIFLNCNSHYKIDKHKLGESNYIIDDYESIKEDKQSIRIEKYSNFKSKMDKIKSYVDLYKSRGINEKDMCIMYVSSKKNSGGYFNQDIKEYLNRYKIGYYDFYSNKLSFQAKLVDDCINISTIHSSKGFEYKIVFLCGLEQEYLNIKNDLKKLVYTGMTRAKEKLIIFTSEKNEITKTLEKTYDFIYSENKIKCINCDTIIDKLDKYCYECSEPYLFDINTSNYLKCKQCNSYNNLHNSYCTICSNKL